MNGHPETLDGALRLFLSVWLVLMLGALAWQLRRLWVARQAHRMDGGEAARRARMANVIAELAALRRERPYDWKRDGS